MLRLYWARCDGLDIDREGLPLSRYRREKLASARSEKVRREGLAAELLLISALEELGIAPPLDLRTGPWGKPYIPGGPELSLSHSEGLVVCALSDEPVGADVQRLRAPDMRVARRVFSQAELDWLQTQEDMDRAFTLLWSLKESAIKHRGLGLSQGDLSSTALIPGSPGLWYSWIGEHVIALSSCYDEPQEVQEIEL